ncbi:MAG: alpha/beta hydrolase [Planctomycetota bacterium]
MQRNIMLKAVLSLIVVFFLASCTELPKESRIWDVESLENENFPEYDAALSSGVNCLAHIPVPTLSYFPAQNGNGTAVVVCPGGGYRKVCYGKEGVPTARWLNALGISAFVLKYRLPGEGFEYPIPLLDAQRAIRLVRGNAGKYGLKPDRIGIMGFSAGGHLTSTAGTHFDYGDKTQANTVDRVSSRPDFMILVYPVVTLDGPYAHVGSRNNLLGKRADDPEMLNLLSNNLQVTGQTPPNILIHARDDKSVKFENSVLFNEACQKANVQSELKLYEKGGHGFALGREGTDSMQWTKDCEQWLRGRGLIK